MFRRRLTQTQTTLGLRKHSDINNQTLKIYKFYLFIRRRKNVGIPNKNRKDVFLFRVHPQKFLFVRVFFAHTYSSCSSQNTHSVRKSILILRTEKWSVQTNVHSILMCGTYSTWSTALLGYEEVFCLCFPQLKLWCFQERKSPK